MSFFHSSQGESCRVGKGVMMCIWSTRSFKVELWGLYCARQEGKLVTHQMLESMWSANNRTVAQKVLIVKECNSELYCSSRATSIEHLKTIKENGLRKIWQVGCNSEQVHRNLCWELLSPHKFINDCWKTLPACIFFGLRSNTWKYIIRVWFFGPVFNLFQGAKGPMGTILMEVSNHLTANYTAWNYLV